MSKPTLGAGNVDIVLDGTTHTLKPSLQAALAISRQRGGIMAAIRAIGEFDIDMIAAVITLGLGLTGVDAKDIPERVYRTPLPDLSGPLITFLSIIANGGKPLAEGGSDEGPGNAGSR